MKRITKINGKKLYVAYGSNLHIEQMFHRCPGSTVFSSGVVKNHLLTFWGTGYRCGVATILPSEGTDVPVGLWLVTPEDEKNLDVYEGYPHLYRKENIEVVLSNGDVVVGMVYIMNHGQPTKPSAGYFNTIASGYKSFGFDRRFLEAARDSVPSFDDAFGFRAI